MNFVPYAIPFFILAILIEFVYARATGRYTYRLNDTLSSLTMGTVSRLMGLIRLGFTAVLFEWLIADHALWQIPTHSIAAWIGAFVLYDLCYYFAHRYGHEWRILWAAHVAHHQSEEFNLSTALRQTSTGWLTAVFYLPLYFIGFPAEMLIAVGSLNLIYQFWVHTEHIKRLGVFDYIFVTPSNHRVHHAKNPCYIDRNYGGVFILWDRLFGTFEDERTNEPCVYGITEQLNSFNPVWANLQVYIQGCKDTVAAKHWRDKLLLWFKGPGFKPEGTDQTPHDWRAPKFDPAATPFVKRYTFVHFWLLVIATFVVLSYEKELKSTELYALAGLCLAGFCTLSAMLENRAGAVVFEIARLVLSAGAALVVMVTTAIEWTLAIMSIAVGSALVLLSARSQWRSEGRSEESELSVVPNHAGKVEPEGC